MKIYPTCATEEYASIRLIWFSRIAAREPRIIPSSPKARITSVTPSSTISSMEKTRRIITSSSTMYPFSHQAGQDGGGRCGGAAVGIRQPQVEGEHGALDAQPRHQQPYSHRQRERVALREPQLRHCLRQRGHQQIAGDAVQNGQPDQEQPGPPPGS